MNIKNEKDRLFKLEAILNAIDQADQKIKSYEEYLNKWGFFSVPARLVSQIEIAKQAKARLENYYKKLLLQ